MMTTTIVVRAATVDDVAQVAELLDEYMRELFGRPWAGSREALTRDGFGGGFELTVAARGERLVAVAAWRSAYDVHWCVRGGEILDLYVRPEERGRGLALRVVTAVAASVQAGGGVYVKGLAVGEPATRALYERVAMAFSGAECIVGGRAFRALALLAGKGARDIVRGLPQRAWNHEP